MVKVLVAAADGIEEVECLSIVDTLRRAGSDVTIASIHDNKIITTSHKVQIICDALFKDCIDIEYDLIVLPGGLPGADNFSNCNELILKLKQQEKTRKWYGAICASPQRVFLKHGFLNNKKATCYPSLNGDFAIKTHIKEHVVIDGKCITGMGPGTALEFGLGCVEALYGWDKANDIATKMLVPIQKRL